DGRFGRRLGHLRLLVFPDSTTSAVPLRRLGPGSISRCDNIVLRALVTFGGVVQSSLRAVQSWSSPPMGQYAEHARLLTGLPTVDEVLDDHASDLGRDRTSYRNHVYRVVNLCVAVLGDSRTELEKIAVAAVFHDLGIWTNKTFDYIASSVALAREYLAARGMADWTVEIEAMIMNHHKVTSSRPAPESLVESFRRADWIDVTRGLRRFGLPRSFITAVAATWPSAGFHRRLVELTLDQWRKHPLSPLPMLKW